MDKERKKRRQTIRLIITEIIMVLAVIVTVVVLTFLAMGYNVNKDGELGQSGLMQLKSVPTGATVEIDGETMRAHTNMSRMLTAGKHNVKVYKEGYDSWSKEITSESGWLLKLDYPRLFLQDRVAEKVREYDGKLEFLSYSNDGNYIVYATKGSKNWKLLDIRGDDVVEQDLKVEKYLDGAEILRTEWSENNDRILVRARKDGAERWALINIRDTNNSINLTAELKMDFSEVKFFTATGERLLVLENGNLRSIMASERTISQVMAEDVESFYNNHAILAYATKERLMLYQEGMDDVILTDLSKDSEVKMALSEYLGKAYLGFAINNRLYIYRGSYPTADRALDEMELLIESDLAAEPEEMAVWSDNQLIMAKNGKNIAMFDAELGDLAQYETETNVNFFLDEYLIGTLSEGELIVRDFDGTNRRKLTSATGAGAITKNHKWLYYYLEIDGKSNIFREKVVD